MLLCRSLCGNYKHFFSKKTDNENKHNSCSCGVVACEAVITVYRYRHLYFSLISEYGRRGFCFCNKKIRTLLITFDVLSCTQLTAVHLSYAF